MNNKVYEINPAVLSKIKLQKKVCKKSVDTMLLTAQMESCVFLL